MPRVAAYRKKYLNADLREWIVGRMNSCKKTHLSMGELLGISQPAFSRRLKNSNFEYAQLLEIFKELNATDEEILKLMKL